ncbi:MAG: DUF2911 domain-containing protein [Crocinitomicaceae bacterium]|nr:DUF2911 domain-containing protein [Crocinitomicaceae bacterium]
MKTIYFSLIIILFQAVFTANIHSQVETPQLSPVCEFKQTVGLTEITFSYSRPSKRDRIVFGNVVPYDKMWRFGANKNSTITISEEIYFGQDTLPKGTYAMFVKPGKESWELNFYSDFSNWGTPEKWDDTKVVLKLKTPVIVLDTPVETMEISIENIGTASATLGISWDQVQVVYPFNLKTQKQVVENIKKVMTGPSASDYYRSAKYYLNEGLNPEQALDWINKAVALRGESAYWMTRVQAELFAKNGNYSQAIQAAKLSITAATKAGNENYVKMNEDSIKQWSKK